MGMEAVVLVGVGGAIGAIARHTVGEMIDVDTFPLATLTVNVAGSFGLAVVTFGPTEGRLAVLVGIGICGAFTTFSSFAFETVRLAETGARPRAVLNVVSNLVGALLAIGVGWALVTLV